VARSVIRLAVVAAVLVLWPQGAGAMYPAPWPDAGHTSVYFGWYGYTNLGEALKDRSGSSDNSTGGSSPQQETDITSGASGDLPSVYVAFDLINDVMFTRMRLARSPLTPTPDGGSNDDPYTSAFWSVLIDMDGDGYKEFILRLDGNIGGSANRYDDLEVYYDNAPSQAIPSGLSPVFSVDAAIFPDFDPRPTHVDFLRSRVIDQRAVGGDWLLDIQVPLSAFNVGGTQLITHTTPFSLGYATANSNTNPLQKDVVFAGDFTAAVDAPFVFGDPLTPQDGILQAPYITGLSVAGCAPSTINATVLDTLVLVGGTPTSTVAHVAFYYQRDGDGDGTPDAGTAPVLIGTATAHAAGDISLWQMTWNTAAVTNGYYAVWVVATDQQGHSRTSQTVVFAVTCGLVGYPVSGFVYNDRNQDGVKGVDETGTGIAGLHVKIVAHTGGAALEAAPVDATTGAYTFPAIPNGTYTLLLDNNATLTDTTPHLPPDWGGSEAPNQVRTGVVVNGAALADQNFGLYGGRTVTGTVFCDNGDGGGTANDGIQNGGEAGIPGVTVYATDGAGAVTYSTAVTDASGQFTLWLPGSTTGNSLRITERNPANFLSTGGSAGTTGGVYDRASDTVTFTPVPETVYAGVAFGDVRANTFVPNNERTVTAGSVVFYPHTFTSGSAGQIAFAAAVSASPDLTGWNHLLYRDVNCNGAVDGGDLPITGPVTVEAGTELCLILKVFAPANAPVNAQYHVTLTAQFTWTNASPALSRAYSVTDLTVITLQGDAGLVLRKTVDRTAASPGDVLTYTVTYENVSGSSLSGLTIHDVTPAFTTFADAACGSLPPELTHCAIGSPAIGATGAITWTFTGTLSHGSSGVVTFQVTVR